jgi:hypothetical protein
MILAIPLPLLWRVQMPLTRYVRLHRLVSRLSNIAVGKSFVLFGCVWVFLSLSRHSCDVFYACKMYHPLTWGPFGLSERQLVHIASTLPLYHHISDRSQEYNC